MKTLKKVKACPENYLNFQDRNKTMYCDSYPQCNGHELFYHCVKFEDGLAEVCAPRSVITGRCCALYDEGLGRVIEDYSRPCSDCPFQYSSDAFVKDSSCVITTATEFSNPPLRETTIVYMSNTTFKGTATTSITPCNKNMRRGKRTAGCESSSTQDTVDESELPGSSTDKMFEQSEQIPKTGSDAIKLTAAIIVVFIIILFAVICFYKRKRIKKWFISEGVVIIKNMDENNRINLPETNHMYLKKHAVLGKEECTKLHEEVLI